MSADTMPDLAAPLAGPGRRDRSVAPARPDPLAPQRWRQFEAVLDRTSGRRPGADSGRGPGADSGRRPGADSGRGPGADSGQGPGAGRRSGPTGDSRPHPDPGGLHRPGASGQARRAANGEGEPRRGAERAARPPRAVKQQANTKPATRSSVRPNKSIEDRRAAADDDRPGPTTNAEPRGSDPTSRASRASSASRGHAGPDATTERFTPNPGPANQAETNQTAVDQADVTQASVDQADLTRAAVDQAAVNQAAVNQAAVDQAALTQAALTQAALTQGALIGPAVDSVADPAAASADDPASGAGTTIEGVSPGSAAGASGTARIATRQQPEPQDTAAAPGAADATVSPAGGPDVAADRAPTGADPGAAKGTPADSLVNAQTAAGGQATTGGVPSTRSRSALSQAVGPQAIGPNLIDVAAQGALATATAGGQNGPAAGTQSGAGHGGGAGAGIPGRASDDLAPGRDGAVTTSPAFDQQLLAKGTDPAAPTQPADGSGPAAGPDPVWRQIQRAVNSVRLTPSGEHQLTIRLRPDDLGSVTVQVTTGEAGTTVALVADSRAAANQLQQQRHLLLQQLETSGLGRTTIDIGLGSGTGSGQGPSADPGSGRGNGKAGAGASPTGGAAVTRSRDQLVPLRSAIASDRTVDLAL
jgi:flagellar hook-length control protein FliK